MIFTQWRQVLDGTKTQTRRAVHPDEQMTLYAGSTTIVGKVKREADRYLQHAPENPCTARNIVTVRHSARLKWALGHTYAVQPKRGAKAVGRYKIDAIRCERLHAITEQDAIAEGVASIAEYSALWERINGAGSWTRNPLVWVIEFHVIATD